MPVGTFLLKKSKPISQAY